MLVPGNTYMFEDTHSHPSDIAGSKDSCGDNTLRVSPSPKTPRLYRISLDKNYGRKVVEILPAIAGRHVVRGTEEWRRELLSSAQSSRNESGVREITGVDRQVETICNDRCRAFRCGHLDRHIRIGS